jgi:hypothetical protein
MGSSQMGWSLLALALALDWKGIWYSIRLGSDPVSKAWVYPNDSLSSHTLNPRRVVPLLICLVETPSS